MKKFRTLNFMIGVGLILTGCSSSHSLPFSVLVEKTPFQVVIPGNQPVPDLIIIASPDEVVPPTPYVQYSKTMMETLKGIDFNNSFVVLHLVGQIPNNGKITKIVRRGNTIRIKLISYSIGPGNYMFKDFTLPYQVTVIEKNEVSWGYDMSFILEVEGGDILAKEQHYIP